MVPLGLLPAYAIVACVVCFITAMVLATDFTYAPDELNAPVKLLISVALTGLLLRGFGLCRSGSFMQAVALFAAISLAAPLCAAILASTNIPLVDDMLLAWDKALFFGFDRSTVAQWVVDRKPIFGAVSLVYNSLTFQPAFLLLLLCAAGRLGRVWRLLCAWGIGLAISIVVFTFLPAQGSPPVFLNYLDTLNGVRDGSLRTVGADMLTGIITFPSFHAAAAVMLGWGFRSLRYIGPAMIVLNALMFLSAAVASHYLVDLIAGGAIAIVAIRLADRLVGWTESRDYFTQSRPISS